MSIDEKTLISLRSALLVAAEALNGLAIAADKFPSRDELLLTLLVCAHVRVAGTVADSRVLYTLHNIVEQIVDVCNVDLSKNPAENHTSEE